MMPLLQSLHDLSARGGVGEAFEAAGIGDLLDGADGAAPGGARQGAADGDAAHAEAGSFKGFADAAPGAEIMKGLE